jgi:hypothetical protein
VSASILIFAWSQAGFSYRIHPVRLFRQGIFPSDYPDLIVWGKILKKYHIPDAFLLQQVVVMVMGSHSFPG